MAKLITDKTKYEPLFRRYSEEEVRELVEQGLVKCGRLGKDPKGLATINGNFYFNNGTTYFPAHFSISHGELPGLIKQDRVRLTPSGMLKIDGDLYIERNSKWDLVSIRD